MHARSFLAAAAVLAALVAPAEAVRNSSWTGKHVAKLKYTVLEPVVKTHGKGKSTEKITDAALVGLDTSFVQAPGSGIPSLRGGITETDPRTCVATGEGFEPQLEAHVRARLFRLNNPGTKVKGKHTLLFEGVIEGGEETDRTLAGSIKFTYKGSRSEGGPIVSAK
jgi:hypothetical protein